MLFLAFLLLPSLACADMAVEIIPGVTHYGGHSTSVEIIPGHRVYQGEIRGSVTDIAPGIQHYQLEQKMPTLSAPYPVSPPERRTDIFQHPPSSLDNVFSYGP